MDEETIVEKDFKTKFIEFQKNHVIFFGGSIVLILTFLLGELFHIGRIAFIFSLGVFLLFELLSGDIY